MSQLHLLRWSFVVGKASFGSLLDEVLPGYDFNEVHRTVVPTDPARAYEALKAVSVGEIRLLEPLIGVRRLPALIRHGRFERNERSTAALDEFVRAGFLVLAERPPDKFVFGAVGRFWSLTSNQPCEPFARVRTSSRSRSPATRRSPSGAIRRSWLRAIRRRLERAEGA